VPNFPNLSSGVPLKYPVERTAQIRGLIYVHEDLSEQRSPLGVPLDDFNLNWADISTADKNTIQNFFNSQQGALATDWSLTIEDPPGTLATYNRLQFAPGQKFAATNFNFGRWSVTLKIRQTFSGGVSTTPGTGPRGS
jgi:hypothetical protein